MLSLPPSVKIFICTVPADMRRAFDGLAAMTTEIIGADPLSGHLFVFCNKRKDRVKILYWDRSGYCLWYKRLEAGQYRFPSDESLMRVEVEASELTMLLEGIEPSQAKRHKRYRRAVAV
jgi:transposase